MSKKIAITTERGFLMSGVALGEPADRRLRPGEIVEVPEAYAEHLIADRFAQAAPTPAKRKRAEPSKAAARLAVAKRDDDLFDVLRGEERVLAGLTGSEVEAFEGLDDAAREKFVAERAA